MDFTNEYRSLLKKFDIENFSHLDQKQLLSERGSNPNGSN
jgi:hypothetical protein